MLTEKEVQALKAAHKQTREKRLADRIKAVLYLQYGLSYPEIAKLLLFDEVTVRRYLKQFKEKGIEGLLQYRYSGGQSKLTATQEEEIVTRFKSYTPQTASEVVKYIQNKYQVSFSVIGATKLLHRLGFSYKKPKIIPGKASKREQTKFINLYNQTKENLGVKDQIYFLDSTHPEHNTQAEYGWILKGKKHDKYIKSNSGRKRLNLNGAYCLKYKTAIVLEEETINAKSVINLLNVIKKKQPHGKIYLILDNARYHHARLVRSWQLHHSRFKFIFLPTYSPNLNLIERLWRFFHAKVTWNRYFKTFEAFREKTLNFFKNLKKYNKELETLMTDSFQLLPP